MELRNNIECRMGRWPRRGRSEKEGKRDVAGNNVELEGGKVDIDLLFP